MIQFARSAGVSARAGNWGHRIRQEQLDWESLLEGLADAYLAFCHGNSQPTSSQGTSTSTERVFESFVLGFKRMFNIPLGACILC
jgi:hypothetical protein